MNEWMCLHKLEMLSQSINEQTMDYYSSSESNNHSDEHIEDAATLRQVALIGGHNKWEWFFLCISIANVLLVVSFVVIIYIANDNHCEYPILCLSSCPEILISGTAVVSLLFAIYGIFREHQYDIYSHCLWFVISLFCCWLSYFRSDNSRNESQVSIVTVATGFWFVSISLAVKATYAPDWIEYRMIGVSDPLAVMYKNLCYFLVVLKSHCIFTVFLLLYSTDMALRSAFFTKDAALYGFYGLVVLYALLVWILGKMAVRRERLFLVRGFYVVNTCFCIVNVVADVFWICYFHHKCKPCQGNYHQCEVLLYYSSLCMAVAFPICTLYLMYLMKKVERGFGYGLKSQSFLDLVSRNSNHLLASSRSALLH